MDDTDTIGLFVLLIALGAVFVVAKLHRRRDQPALARPAGGPPPPGVGLETKLVQRRFDPETGNEDHATLLFRPARRG
jgi:hypothetical protein